MNPVPIHLIKHFHDFESAVDPVTYINNIPYRKDLPPGSASWAYQGEKPVTLLFSCPCGCGQMGGLPVEGPSVQGWKWNGNIEKPTMTPSVLMTDGCRWHGYLTNGQWQSV